MNSLLLSIAGGFAYRIRGGMLDSYVGKLLNKPKEWEISNGIIRSVWALFVTAVCPFINWYILPLVFALAFIGCSMGYWTGQFSVQQEKNQNIKNYAILTIRGFFIIAPVAALYSLFGIHSIWFGAVGGLLFIPCYFAGISINSIYRKIGYTQWGEFLLGVCISFGLIL